MTLLDSVLLFTAAMLAGALNSVAGGGSFLSFPALVFTGTPEIEANATSTVALLPGTLASSGAYRKELASQSWFALVLAGTSMIGGILGAFLLLSTPPELFQFIVPYLLLVATLLFTFSSPITSWLRARTGPEKTAHEHATHTWRSQASVVVLQLVTAIYGGFFGGGIGILMLASFSLLGLKDIHVMNGLKTMLASCINAVAVVIFVIEGIVYWPQAIVMLIGAALGGYGGAAYARQLDPRLVRRFVIVVGFGMTIIFFVRGNT